MLNLKYPVLKKTRMLMEVWRFTLKYIL